MPTRIASRRDWGTSTFLTVTLASVLAIGFIPTSREFYRWVSRLLISPIPQTQFVLEAGERAAFPLLAALFLISLPAARPRRPKRPLDYLSWLEISILPICIALGFGMLRGFPSFITFLDTRDEKLDLLWYLMLVPLGEELLFRGWFYEVVERVWPRWATATNPLPLAVWMSSLAFSLWHLQNLWRDPLPGVLFQSLYTFFTGMWLGYMRWRTGRLTPGILAHMAINFATNLI